MQNSPNIQNRIMKLKTDYDKIPPKPKWINNLECTLYHHSKLKYDSYYPSGSIGSNKGSKLPKMYKSLESKDINPIKLFNKLPKELKKLWENPEKTTIKMDY